MLGRGSGRRRVGRASEFATLRLRGRCGLIMMAFIHTIAVGQLVARTNAKQQTVFDQVRLQDHLGRGRGMMRTGTGDEDVVLKGCDGEVGAF